MRMNSLNKILFLTILILIYGSVSSAQNCFADLIIDSDIEAVEVFVNNNSIGLGGHLEIKLELGTYIITVNENSDRWDARSYTDTLLITECKEIKLNYFFRSEVLLDSEPQNVYVFYNDSLIGYTPLLIPANLEKLKLKKPGYLDTEIQKDEIYSSEIVKLDFIGQETVASFFDGTLFKLLIGSAVLLGASTAYVKLEADKKFDEYLITGEQVTLDKTNRLDLISGVTFVALQINFGLIIYLFLTD